MLTRTRSAFARACLVVAAVSRARAAPGRENAALDSGRWNVRGLASSVREHGRDQRCECPLFDAHSETCRVYAARPLVCRSYGFYAGRKHDAWCELVAAHVADTRDHLLLGNLDAVEAELGRIDADRRSLLDWLDLAGS